jgi:hypothetical protein
LTRKEGPVLGFSVRASGRLGCVCVLAAVLGAGGAAAVTEDNFKLRTGSDIVELCSTPLEDRLFQAAIHMCHGFGVSSYQTLAAISTHEKIGAFFCPPPEGTVSRNQAIADFLGWAKQPQNASHLNDSPAALVARYLLTKYPCPKPAAAGGAVMRSQTVRISAVAAAAALLFSCLGCANLTPTQQRAATGTMAGAAGGAIIGAIAGDAGLGAGIGAGVGLLGGLAVDQIQKSNERAYQEGVAAGRSSR